jgi:hypothetical protein
MLYAHTRDHNASTNVDHANEVCRLRLSMRDDYPQSRAACGFPTQNGMGQWHASSWSSLNFEKRDGNSKKTRRDVNSMGCINFRSIRKVKVYSKLGTQGNYNHEFLQAIFTLGECILLCVWRQNKYNKTFFRNYVPTCIYYHVPLTTCFGPQSSHHQVNHKQKH